MTNKRFERIYADVDVFCRDNNSKGISQFIERDDYDKIVDLLNELHEENKELRSDLIDHSALITMLEDYQALKIEDTLWNLTGAESNEEFDKLYEPYLEKAKKNWSTKND